MDVIAPSPLRVASMVWQPRPGAFALVFVCKATYALTPGTAPLAETPDDLHLRDQHWDDDERRSLARAADLVPFKRHAEVLLNGHAHAPGGQPVPSLLARLVAGDVDKTVAVYGDRTLGRDDRVSEPLPFVRSPLLWERAAGGPGTWNPAGMLLDAPPDARGAVAIPNLLPPDRHVTGRRDVIPPAGFMPIASWWPGRREKLGPRATGWDPRRWSEVPLPDDVDAGFFNAAPADQQVPEIRADERLLLVNLHPGHARLATNLEAISLSAMAEVGGANQEVRLRCDTLSIDADRGTASLVWRGQVRLTHPSQPGRVMVTMARRGLPGLAAIHAKLGGTGSLDPAVVRRGAALPFGQGAGGPSSQAPALPSEGVALPGLAAAHKKFGGTASIDPAIVRQRLALPFEQAPSAPSSPVAGDALAELARAHAKFGGTTGIDPTALQKGESLPFVPGVSGLATVARPAEPETGDALPGLREAHAKFGGTTGIDLSALQRAAMPFGSGTPAPQSPPDPPRTAASSAPVPLFTLDQQQPAPVHEPFSAAPEAPPPPPMIGPLATQEMVAGPQAPTAPSSLTAALQPVSPVESPLPLDAYPLQRCAAITASVARRKAERSAILGRHELTEEMWTRLERHWTEAISKALGSGKPAMLEAFDTAYVAQLEAERGAITVEEYTRLVVSPERGAEKETLEELDLPGGAVMRVRRLWEKKMGDNPALGRRVRQAINDAGDA
jgi:hypothetical protein